jgi:hypothetical protein
MKRIGNRLRTPAFALCVTAGLGFGAAQALAAPGEAGGAARACDQDRICTFQCGAAGGREIYRGICICCPPF